MADVKIVGVHGLGDHRDSTWADDWRGALQRAIPDRDDFRWDFDPLGYDHLFETVDISAWEAAAAFGKLVGSGISSAAESIWDSTLGALFRRNRRGLLDSVNHTLRWTAGYVVAWLEDDAFRRQTRQLILEMLRNTQPDILLAHSLGSLLTYDALSHPEARSDSVVRGVMEKMVYVTLGSQIGNAFVRKNLTPGRIEGLPVAHWYHLYNREDAVFTARVSLPGVSNFTQVDTYFDISGFADHNAVEYLSHEGTRRRVWQPVANAAAAAPGGARRAKAIREELYTPTAKREPRRRALLVGINEYPDPSARLEGCVNDVFLMSEVLQECDFKPEQIRVCLDHRATAQGIVDRMAWLFDDPIPGDELVFYYSGHGARLPTYGQGDQIDRMDETLVPHDFNWSPDTCITDDQIFDLYSQLPYETRAAMIFDCCHSGGIHRSGAVTVRGIDPPDDIRHRDLQWNKKDRRWEPRTIEPIVENFFDSASDEKSLKTAYMGSNGYTYRLGRAMSLRSTDAKAYAEARKEAASPAKGRGKKKPSKKRNAAQRTRPVGPYLPLIIMSCQEDQYAYEYRHGVTSYGAFTYNMAKTLRDSGRITYNGLLADVASELKEMNYEQKPAILGPSTVLDSNVPWRR